MNQLKDQLKDIISFAPPYLSTLSPSEWSEAHRVMTSDVSPFPGKFSYDRTPYLREPIDCLAADHPARVVVVQKGAQIGFSTGVIENGIGWIMSQNPGNILLAARDESLVKTMMESKIDQMIDSCGLRDMIRPTTLRKKNSRTGDTSTSKEFPGGNLKAFSVQTPAKMRQISCQYGFLDDFEAAPSSKDAGDAGSLFETRFAAHYSHMKLFYISTPEVAQTSNIEPLYLRGDQRKYCIPCPCCGDFIPLEWKLVTDDFVAGITYKLDTKGNVIKDSTGYTCQSCGGFFTDKDKYQMLLDGHWKPTATPEEEGYYSYHLSALYAPLGMYNWEHYARQYVKCCPTNGSINKEKYKTFVNTTLGNTWIELGDKPEAKGIALNTREYEPGFIPKLLSESDGNGKIVMISCGADLGGNVEDCRIDFEVVAWSENGTPYSIDHGSFGTFVPRENQKKVVHDREKFSYDTTSSNSVWTMMQGLLDKEYPCDNGDFMRITFTGIDTGHFTRFAYTFIDNSPSVVFGLKGKAGERKQEADTRTFKVGRERGNLFIVDVNQIKDELSGAMKLKWGEGSDQPVGFLNFPTPSGGKYTFSDFFSHYESEERKIKTSKTVNTSSFEWVKRNSAVQNHLWDCRVYNMVIRDIGSHLICKENGAFESWENYSRIILDNY